MKKIILASASPRRRELIQQLPVKVEIITREVEEYIDSNQTPEYNVCMLAEKKARVVSAEYYKETIIGCDTVVAYKHEILGKPRNKAHAREMLEKLSGQIHHVYTGVSIINENKGIYKTWSCCSAVTMKTLSEEEIEWYLETQESMDKAGAYGIQGYGGLFVQGIEGDYFNIVGLPLNSLYEQLQMLNLI